MSNSSKRYNQEFKDEAIRLAERIGVPRASNELGVTAKSLHEWIKKLSPDSRARAVSSGKSAQELESENRKLRKENEYLKMINDVLKKSTAIFSKDQIKDSK